MVSYETIQNKYKYNMEDIDRILEMIQTGNFYNEDYCTQENVSELLSYIDAFLNNMEVSKENVTLERRETEEEARAYFGEDFITAFEQLLTRLDREDTIVALHGTSEGVCPLICESGLQYKSSSINATAVKQKMAYGQREMKYDNYESLLNWGHKNYKGLVIVAIPYECFYKEGLWNKYQDTNTFAYGGQDYRIDPDFIAGYIDVTEKKVVLNPKYNRQHDYSNYVKDNDIFREIKDIDNNELREILIKQEKALEEEMKDYSPTPKKEEIIDPSRVGYLVEDLIGTFNSIKGGLPYEITEERYKSLLERLSYVIDYIRKAIPLLKTNEQIKKEQEEKLSMFAMPQTTDLITDQEGFGDFDWGEDIVWDEPEEGQTQKFY